MKSGLFFLSFFIVSCLAAQINNINSSIEVVHEGPEGEFIRINTFKEPYIHEKILNKTGWDTLYILVDQPDPLLTILGQDYIYYETDVVWVSPFMGYLILNSEHEFNILARWSENTLSFIVFEENYSFTGTDTLEISRSEAIYEIELNPVDKNSIPFGQISGNITSLIAIMIPHAMGYYQIGYFSIYSTTNAYTFYFSEMSGEFQLSCSSMYNNTPYQNDSYYVEFPLIHEINQSIVLNNDPDQYKLACFDIFASYDTFNNRETAILNGIVWPDIYGSDQISAFGQISFPGNMNNWKGELYIINQEHDNVKPTVILYFSTPWGYLNSRFCLSPGIEVINDSICAFNSSTLPHNIYKTSIGDTLFFGESPITQVVAWANNNPYNAIFATRITSFGQLRETTIPISVYPYYEFKDENGNVIFFGNGDYIYYEGIQPGIYSGRIINLSCPFNNGNSISQLLVNFNYGAEDGNPPSISPVQFQNSMGVPTTRIDEGDQLMMYFNASDFDDIYHDTVNIFYMQREYQPVVDDSTRVFIKVHDSMDWQEANLENYHEDSISGICYRSDLSAFTNIDSSSLDIKIKIQDYSGNTAEFLISPAILVGDDINTGFDHVLAQDHQIYLSIFPNPTRSIVNIRISASAQTEAMLGVYSIDGEQILFNSCLKLNQGKNTIVLDLTEQTEHELKPGVYLIVLTTGNEMLTRKVILN